jgi:peptidoglycan/xylan/chitin deacetylase (PgdA/CDA1 family)
MKNVPHIFIVSSLASLFLQSCASAPLLPIPISVNTPVPATQTATAEAPVPTPIPSETPLPHPQPTPVNTPTPVPDPIRRTPATLMLHRRNAQFDSVQFLKDFIAILKQNEMEVVTYRKLATKPDLTIVKQGKLFIVTIDDIYLRYPIDPSVLEMINLLVDAGYPAVLGVVTESDYAYPETVETLRKLQNIGWEIASHSDTHRNLAKVEKIAPKSIYPEIKTSLDKIEKTLAIRPITLILPEGQMTRGDEQIKRSGVLWVIGINGGTKYDTREPYHYLGREGPDGSAQNTFAIMYKRFNP